jgi:hypothetical protein
MIVFIVATLPKLTLVIQNLQILFVTLRLCHFVKTFLICDGRNDQWSTDVKGRLQNCNDLVAVEAVYHCTCINNFRRGFACPGSVCVTGPSAPAFRPDCVQKMAAFEQLCAWLESSAEPNTYSLEELCNHMIAAGNASEEVYSEKQLQRLLEKHLVRIACSFHSRRADVT